MVSRFLAWLLYGRRTASAVPCRPCPPVRVAAVAPPPVPAPYPTDAPWVRELCGVVPRTDPGAWRSN